MRDHLSLSLDSTSLLLRSTTWSTTGDWVEMGDEKEIGILYTKLDSKTLETIGPLWDEEPGNNCQQKPNEGIQNKQNI